MCVFRTHGMSRTRVYAAWAAMKDRCYREKNAYYPHYGGRGITVCERWQTFESFLEDMGEPPPGYSLDRIDNNGIYEPGNCRWATPTQQAVNRRKLGNKTSKFRGVVRHKRSGKWQASITVGGHLRHGGLFETEYAAAQRYNELAREVGYPQNTIPKDI